MTAATEPPPTMAEEEIARTLKSIAERWGHTQRSPLLKNPGDHGLEYEDVVFPSQDGIPLEAWFIPCPGSKRLVIANHPLGFNRWGCPSDVEPWRTFGQLGGNTFEVDYIEDYRILHDHGCNVLTYDERSFGTSAEGNGGLTSAGRYESRDVIGSLQYVRSRSDLRDMEVSLFSRCNGANATMFAMHSQPAYFDDVRCLIACQPLSVRPVMTRNLEARGLSDRMDQLERECRLVVSLGFDEMSPVEWAKRVRTPTFLYQVHDDARTFPDDVQGMFDNLAGEKALHWIEGSTTRWDGYLEFQRRPQPMLDWLDRHMP